MRQRMVVMGSAWALSSATRDNTFLFFDSPGGGLLIDCAGSPFHKLLKVGSDPGKLQGVILTHAHPDHIYGLPSLVHELWLWGRKESFYVYANVRTQKAARTLIGLFGLWDKPMPLELVSIPQEEGGLLVENDEYAIHTTPVRHLIPTNAVRVTPKIGKRVVTYSSDTRPCEELVALAKGSDLLFLECTAQEPHRAHLTPEQAGEIAQEAEAKELVLVHYLESMAQDPEGTIARVKKFYEGEARLASDFDEYSL
jgi:ribonuclease Z